MIRVGLGTIEIVQYLWRSNHVLCCFGLSKGMSSTQSSISCFTSQQKMLCPGVVRESQYRQISRWTTSP